MTEHDDRCAVPATAAIPADAPMFNRAAWIRILPFAAYLAFIVVGDVLERLGVRQDTLRWLYPAKIALVALLLALFRHQYQELSRPGFPRSGSRRDTARCACPPRDTAG